MKPTKMTNDLIHHFNTLAGSYRWRKKKELQYVKGTVTLTVKELDDTFFLVTTTLMHPKKGWTTLTRKLLWCNVSTVFADPRSHTDYAIGRPKRIHLATKPLKKKKRKWNKPLVVE